MLSAEDPTILPRCADTCFAQYPSITIDGKNLFRAKNGTPFPIDIEPDTYRVYDPDGVFLLLGECADGMMNTIKSFFEVT